MKYSFHPEAEAEFIQAIAYYEERESSLGYDFADHLADQRLAACRQLSPPGADPLIEVLTEPFDPDILAQLPPGAVAAFLVEQFSQVVQSLEPIDEAVLAYAEKLWKKQGRKTPLPVRGLLAEQKILRGDLDEALALVECSDDEQAGGGVGACLADDMGLGKTLQALALILTRAREGPCLVVAPTSVCPNWANEAARFAPTLNVIPFGPGDRGQTIEDLKPFDLLVASYGLLLQETERLAAVKWTVVVLDEAQAIKNVVAKRSRAAMELRADFKIITTGTPVENHLGELLNLFRFLNPGLLGSLESFTHRFAVPIERDGDRNARARLKRLTQPFLLRRIKSQVLEDLPPRTEILHRVQFGGGGPGLGPRPPHRPAAARHGLSPRGRGNHRGEDR